MRLARWASASQRCRQIRSHPCASNRSLGPHPGTGAAYVADLRSSAPAQRVAWIPGTVENAEMSWDGAEVAVASSEAVYLWREGEVVRLLEDLPNVHSLWFAADGRLAWANRARVVVREGDALHRLEVPEDDVRTMRFVRGGPGVVVVRSTRALAWVPGLGRPTVLAQACAGETLQYADVWRGQAVWATAHGGHFTLD